MVGYTYLLVCVNLFFGVFGAPFDPCVRHVLVPADRLHQFFTKVFRKLSPCRLMSIELLIVDNRYDETVEPHVAG